MARDGEEAVQLLLRNEPTAPLPDLILLDWNLPKISGDEVLRRVKQHPDLRKIPILVFSSSDADADILSAYANHANGYITKPADYDALEAIVETIERFCHGGATAQGHAIGRPLSEAALSSAEEQSALQPGNICLISPAYVFAFSLAELRNVRLETFE